MSRLWPVEAEEAIIGAILCAASYSADAGHRVYRCAVAAGLKSDDFGAASHGVLFATIAKMVDAGVPVDAASLAAELDRDDADPHVVQRLRALAASVPAFDQIEHRAGIVVEAAARRDLEERAS